MNARQRKNLLKLAAYLESLPRDYRHFDMGSYADHEGDCELPASAELLVATKPSFFLNNCGTVACAAGHGPAAGIKVPDTAFFTYGGRRSSVNWSAYIAEQFGVAGASWSFLFGGSWDVADNHHYGAAARIRYFIANGVPRSFGFSYDGYDNDYDFSIVKTYAPYRKGSRSAKRREIDAASAGEAGTAGTTKIGPVHEHATAEGGDAQ